MSTHDGLGSFVAGEGAAAAGAVVRARRSEDVGAPRGTAGRAGYAAGREWRDREEQK